MVDKPTLSLKPTVAVVWEAVMECGVVVSADKQVMLLERTTAGEERLHTCMREVTHMELARVSASEESHPVAQLLVSVVGKGVFEKGKKYRVKVEPVE